MAGGLDASGPSQWRAPWPPARPPAAPGPARPSTGPARGAAGSGLRRPRTARGGSGGAPSGPGLSPPRLLPREEPGHKGTATRAGQRTQQGCCRGHRVHKGLLRRPQGGQRAFTPLQGEGTRPSPVTCFPVSINTAHGDSLEQNYWGTNLEETCNKLCQNPRLSLWKALTPLLSAQMSRQDGKELRGKKSREKSNSIENKFL